MKIDIHQPLFIYEIGQRNNQEDALYPEGDKVTANNHLFVLCDGMGGHDYGEVASRLVCNSIPHYMEKAGVLYEGWFDDDIFKNALEFAYQQLDRESDASLRKMGTTLTLLYIHRGGITAAHMGDSRIYHIRPDEGVLYQSRDHSLVFDLFQAGEITIEEVKNYPKKNIVTRVMTPGLDNRMHPDVIHITDIQPNDYFYMCSDGMLESMSNQEIVSILSSNKTDLEKREELIDKTKINQDNHSAWLIHIKDVLKDDSDKSLPNEEMIARCNVMVCMPEIVSSDKEDNSANVKLEKKSFFQRVRCLFNIW